jgi:hypothetical protein
MQYLTRLTFGQRIDKLFLAATLAFLFFALVAFAVAFVWNIEADTSNSTLPETEQFQPSRHLLM